MHKHESPWIFGRSIIPIERRLPDRPNVFSQELSNKGSDSTEKNRTQQGTLFTSSTENVNNPVDNFSCDCQSSVN